MDNLQVDEAIRLTQDRLVHEGGTLGDLIEHFRHLIPPVLIGDASWAQIVKCAQDLPVTIGALPLGFELPLHEARPHADFGASLASDTWAAEFFKERAVHDQSDETAQMIVRVLNDMNAQGSKLRRLVGPKMMLEYDIGSARSAEPAGPALFLRPYVRPIFAAGEQLGDVYTAAEALVGAVGWKIDGATREHLRRVYLAAPGGARMDSFGIFPARGSALRLLIMGIESQHELSEFLGRAGWPGDVSAVASLVARFSKRLNIHKIGAHLDLHAGGVGPTLGLTPIIKERFSYNTRYFFDDLGDWTPFIEALENEPIIAKQKLPAIAELVSKPTPLFGRSGRYVLLRGIHHIKLVMTDSYLSKVKAYMFMVLTAGLSD